MITQPKGAEAMRDPPQPPAGGVRSLWVGISGSNDFGEQCQSRIAHFVLFHNGVEQYVLARHGQKNRDFKHAHSICSPDHPDLTKATLWRQNCVVARVWVPWVGEPYPSFRINHFLGSFCKNENAPVLSGVAGRCINFTSWVRFVKKTFLFSGRAPRSSGVTGEGCSSILHTSVWV